MTRLNISYITYDFVLCSIVTGYRPIHRFVSDFKILVKFSQNVNKKAQLTPGKRATAVCV